MRHFTVDATKLSTRATALPSQCTISWALAARAASQEYVSHIRFRLCAPISQPAPDGPSPRHLPGARVDPDFTLELAAAEFAPPAPDMFVTRAGDAQAVVMIELAVGWQGGWHPSPTNQWVVCLFVCRGRWDIEPGMDRVHAATRHLYPQHGHARKGSR